MRFTFDPGHNIAYIRLREKCGEVESVRVSDELTVDIAPDGTVYGIELLNANDQLRRGDAGTILVINEATGERAELPLAIGSCAKAAVSPPSREHPPAVLRVSAFSCP